MRWRQPCPVSEPLLSDLLPLLLPLLLLLLLLPPPLSPPAAVLAAAAFDELEEAKERTLCLLGFATIALRMPNPNAPAGVGQAADAGCAEASCLAAAF